MTATAVEPARNRRQTRVNEAISSGTLPSKWNSRSQTSDINFPVACRQQDVLNGISPIACRQKRPCTLEFLQ